MSHGQKAAVAHGQKAAVPRNPDGKKQRKPTINVKEARQYMHLHLLVRGNTWAGPRNCRAGPYRARVSRGASLPRDGPGRAGSSLLKNDGPGRVGP